MRTCVRLSFCACTHTRNALAAFPPPLEYSNTTAVRRDSLDTADTVGLCIEREKVSRSPIERRRVPGLDSTRRIKTERTSLKGNANRGNVMTAQTPTTAYTSRTYGFVRRFPPPPPPSQDIRNSNSLANTDATESRGSQTSGSDTVKSHRAASRKNEFIPKRDRAEVVLQTWRRAIT